MHQLLKTLTGISLIGVVGLASAFGQAQQPPAQQGQAAQTAAQAPKKNWKDQAEYDMFASITKQSDPNKKLALLNSWKEKYPNTDFKQERNQLYLATYQALGNAAKMMDTAKEMLAADPKDFQALSVIIFLAPSLNNASPDALDTAEKAANQVLAADKPAAMSDADWAKAKQDVEALAHKTLGWVAMQRKNNEVAEQEFKKSLQIHQQAGEVAYWLGTVIVSQKKPEKQSEALFYFARAASYDGPGSLPPAGRQQIDTYFTKAFNSFHGQDDAELQKLKELAKAQAFPPQDFKIKSATEIAIEKEEEFKKSNPQLALWMGIKKELTGPGGESYFESSVKGAAVPKLKGKVISEKPAVRPKELVLALADPTTPEVTLKLDEPIAGKVEIGSDLEFEGVPSAFTKDPFMVTFDVEKAKLEGLKVEAPPAPVRKPRATKKAPARKKG